MHGWIGGVIRQEGPAALGATGTRPHCADGSLSRDGSDALRLRPPAALAPPLSVEEPPRLGSSGRGEPDPWHPRQRAQAKHRSRPPSDRLVGRCVARMGCVAAGADGIGGVAGSQLRHPKRNWRRGAS